MVLGFWSWFACKEVVKRAAEIGSTGLWFKLWETKGSRTNNFSQYIKRFLGEEGALSVGGIGGTIALVFRPAAPEPADQCLEEPGCIGRTIELSTLSKHIKSEVPVSLHHNISGIALGFSRQREHKTLQTP